MASASSSSKPPPVGNIPKLPKEGDEVVGIAKKCWNKFRDEATFALYTPFIIRLASGTLEVKTFGHCVSQGVYFVKPFDQALELAEANAEDDDAKHRIRELKKTTEWGPEVVKDTTQNRATTKCTEFLLATATGAVTSCIRLYAYIGKELQGLIDAPKSDQIRTENQIARMTSSDLTNIWEDLSKNYKNDYDQCIENILATEKAEKFDFEGLLDALEQLSDFEKKANLRVIESVVGVVTSLDLPFHQRVESPIDKLQAKLLVKNCGSDRKKRLDVYIGDSVGDLACLLEAYAGIVVGSNSSLRRLGTHFGVRFIPLFRGVVDQQKERAVDSGILYTASSWAEIHAFVIGS
nr:probable aminopyrimidine aminohydrolase, mitochondrial [Ipomoea batatas]